MIKVVYTPKTRQLRMTGHAGYAEEGQDIICASASTLFYTLCQSLISLEKGLTKEPEMYMTKGRASVKCIPKSEYEAKVDNIYWTVLNGFHMLAQQYPEYVNLQIQNK